MNTTEDSLIMEEIENLMGDYKPEVDLYGEPQRTRLLRLCEVIGLDWGRHCEYVHLALLDGKRELDGSDEEIETARRRLAEERSKPVEDQRNVRDIGGIAHWYTLRDPDKTYTFPRAVAQPQGGGETGVRA